SLARDPLASLARDPLASLARGLLASLARVPLARVARAPDHPGPMAMVTVMMDTATMDTAQSMVTRDMTKKNTDTRDMAKKNMVTKVTTTTTGATALMAAVEAPLESLEKDPLANRARDPLESLEKVPLERAARDLRASQAKDLRVNLGRDPLVASPERDQADIPTWVGPVAVVESQRTMDTAMATVATATNTSGEICGWDPLKKGYNHLSTFSAHIFGAAVPYLMSRFLFIQSGAKSCN
ncbi:hypothetical protein ACHAWX_000919, partial [Stephanocyclus meneghinianus]